MLGYDPSMSKLKLHPATRTDIPTIARLIQGLAEFEKLAHEVKFSHAGLEETLFGEKPYAEVVLAEWDGEAAGFALFFHNYSTFLAKPGIYLEDLFVLPDYRSKGIGLALFEHLARLANQRGCGRFEWSVLDWNVDAIRFYRRLGVKPMEEWTVQRLSGPELEKFGT
jgi:GNAT superfamily N-acetyltransferase